MSYFTHLLEGGYEAVHLLTDSKTGLRAIVGMHNTKLGPGLGGTRALATYASEDDAVIDALRLARGMTYKAALAGLPHGGGKAVIMLPKGPFDRVKLFESFGRAVESLGGRYITTEDSGTSPDDMEYVRRHTKYVVGLKERSGDPSPVTAFGVTRAMEATAKHVFGRSDLKGLRVTVLGVGHVGMPLVKELHERGAKVWVSDVNAASVEHAVKQYGATAVTPDELLRMEADVYAPCALGGAINDTTLPLLKVKAVCGAANNQLLTPGHGEQLAQRGITYVPDYAANAGGLINVAQEWAGYDRAKAYARAERIFDTIDEVLTRAKASGLRPEQVADRIVEEKLAA
ncbi:leucine dehydrogenase [Corallococcus sp. H22C18031201]|uniref:Leu/Phe/Val dehydrogenase n=1 Tax=Citreicoccus inhibens TaxID=2849499 RepID=UPI000E771A88|nr:Glu/Leu/Phe/Val dehydrogenase dimerization domain-containing protein [Citreicoccus inhibens]MBU8896298.1 Glu/Leu/Phe/Val dehydrogenase [Citreicoccus inhibens]RJS17370.1 leucine dehydrogenase [Corallococcus sp. H22C18031201]